MPSTKLCLAFIALGLTACSPTTLWGNTVVYSRSSTATARSGDQDQGADRRSRHRQEAPLRRGDRSHAPGRHAREGDVRARQQARVHRELARRDRNPPGRRLGIAPDLRRRLPPGRAARGARRHVAVGGDSLFSAGKKAYDANQKHEATRLFELALVRDVSKASRGVTIATARSHRHYSSRLDEDAGRPDDAKRAYPSSSARRAVSRQRTLRRRRDAPATSL